MKCILKVIFILSLAFILNMYLSKSNIVYAQAVPTSGQVDRSQLARTEESSGISIREIDVLIIGAIIVTGGYYYYVKKKKKDKSVLRKSLLQDPDQEVDFLKLEDAEKKRKAKHKE